MTKYMETQMKKAVKNNDIATIAKRLAKGAVDVNDVCYDLGATLLHLATKQGNKEMAKFLIDNGADINSVNKYGDTPLMYALYWYKDDMVKFLIDNGADINKSDPLAEALGRYDHTSANMLIEAGAVITPNAFSAACGVRDTAEVEMLISLGANAADGLHRAVQYGHKTIAELLIKHGADINGKDRAGRTPIEVAGGEGIRLLVEHGVDPNVEDGGNTPLKRAIKQRSVDLVTYLLEHGADANFNNPLDEAIRTYNIDLVRVLVEHGADVNDNVMGTATYIGNANIINYLREHGGNYVAPKPKQQPHESLGITKKELVEVCDTLATFISENHPELMAQIEKCYGKRSRRK